ncbi:MAG: flagellar hook-associated protein FlgL [Azonexus sp.]|jgi:flagellar hook-associated protein 3 FlgL|nr:flagellar hook-associated protein FlgL [Azonexus sp.]
MRIGTALQFNTGIRNIQNQQSELYRAQTQLSSGKRMLSPSDDPLAAMEAMQVEQAKGVNAQFQANQDTAKSKLATLESTLGNLGDNLSAIRTAMIAAGNAAYNDSDRESVAQELSQRLDALVDLANTRDSNGNYVFSGFQSSVKPFEQVFNPLTNRDEYTYRGDQGQVSLQVAPSVNMAIGENGDDIFMRVRDAAGNPGGKDVFVAIQDVIQNLRGQNPPSVTNPTGKFSAEDLTNSIGNIDAAMDNILLKRTDIGARLNTLDNLSNSAGDFEYIYTARLSQLQDVDYAEAISRFSRYQMQLEATQITFRQASQMSLFSLI